MSELRLTLSAEPPVRLDLSAITPAALAGKSAKEIAAIEIGTGTKPLALGAVFKLSGDIADGAIRFEGGSARFDQVGAGLDGGTICVDGDVGDYAGAAMASGRLIISGNARHHLASSMAGGLVTVSGDAGDCVGAPRPGVRDGMAGGAVVVAGSAGDFCGERQRRGLVVVKGGVGHSAGGRMLGGTIWSLEGFGENLAIQMRRGTILTPRLSGSLSTFTDCGMHRLGILAIMSRHYADVLGDLAPPMPSGPVQRFAGDMASLGRGEILVYTSP